MTRHPTVDVNLFVYNGAATVGAAIESVLAQSWPAVSLTVIDNASTDATVQVVRDYAIRTGRVTLRRNRADVGPVLNCQRAFWQGDDDFVMPKTADDLLAPDFVERVMSVLLAHPDTSMCHAAGLVFAGAGEIRMVYPEEHRLAAIGPDPEERARHVMARYTSAPSFWGIYRRAAVDRLARIPYRAGWDHALLAELALYGELRHVPDVLFWRRDGGKPVTALARGCSEYTQRGLAPDDRLAELRWRTPLITTAYAHVEQFALARLDEPVRCRLMTEAVRIFRARWLPLMRMEAAQFRAALPGFIEAFAGEEAVVAGWMAGHLSQALRAIEAVLPEEDFTLAHLEIATLAGAAARSRAA